MATCKKWSGVVRWCSKLGIALVFGFLWWFVLSGFGYGTIIAIFTGVLTLIVAYVLRRRST